MTEETRQEPMGNDDDNVLAAEYVLGVLSAAERSACTARLQDDHAFADLVASWEDRLSGLNEGFVPVAVPGAVKAAIDQRLFAGQQVARAEKPSLWQSLAFWRGFSGVAVAALALLAVIVLRAPDMPVPGEVLVASLASENSDARFVAIYDTGTQALRISAVAGQKPADRDYELWFIEGDKAPVSLGLVGADGSRAPAVTDVLKPGFVEGITLAVSLEPEGGSTTGAPTGPVIAVGTVKKI